MTSDEIITTYWRHFILLENRLNETQTYVEFDKHNRGTFSIEFLSLFQTVCSEIDVLAKEIAKEYNPEFIINGATGIKQWGYQLQNCIDGFENIEAIFFAEEHIQPFKNWKYHQKTDKKGRVIYKLDSGKSTPKWWLDYDKVKHARTSKDDNGNVNYWLANQGNVITSMAALFILIRLFLRKVNPNEYYGLESRSKLFQMSGWKDEIRITNGIDADGYLSTRYSEWE